jgi:hypothetical protein
MITHRQNSVAWRLHIQKFSNLVLKPSLMKKNLCIFCILALPVFSTCKKDKIPTDVITIQGFALTDGLGNLIAVVGGNANDDWQIGNWTELSAMEQSFLNFSDNVDLANTTVTTLHKPVAYPNPVNNLQFIYFAPDDSVKLKIALVDARGHVLRTFRQNKRD